MFDRRLWREAQANRPLLLATIVLQATAGVFTVLAAVFLSRTVDLVFLHDQTPADVHPLLQTLIAVIAGRAAALWLGDVCARMLAVDVKSRLRNRLFIHLQQLGPAHHEGEQTGDVSNTLLEGIESLDAYFSQYLPQLVLAVVVPLTILLAVFPIDVLSGIVLALTAPLIPVFMALIGRGAQRLTGRQWNALSAMSARLLDLLQGLTTLKELGQSRAQVDRVARISEQFRRITLSVLRITFLSALALELVATLSVAVVAVEIGLRLLRGSLVFGDALFILLLAPEFYLPLRLLGARFHAGMEGKAASQRLFRLLDASPPVPATGGVASHTPAGPLHVRFENVHYRYPGRDHHAVAGLALQLEPGSIVALTGHSGAGKSTVAHLLLRFVQPQEGHITVNGTPLEKIAAVDWRRCLAWVPQSPYLFRDTVRANIALGLPGSSECDVVAAARQADADTFIRALPDGYDTVIGERGVRLSAGQAQRIALARAFLRDAPLLILDEPAANLDPESAASIQQAMRSLARQRTVLLIAHSGFALRDADRVVRLEQGQIVASANMGSTLAPNGNGAESPVSSGPRPARFAAESDTETNDGALPLARQAIATPDVSYSNPGPATFRSLLRLVVPLYRTVILSVLLGFLTVASGAGLLATSAYLISAAALQPSIAALNVSIVGVRFFGLSRGIFRYLERLASHSVTFHLLTRLRVTFYAALEPLVPARLLDFHSGDLLTRLVADIRSLESFYVRALAPPLVAILVTISLVLVYASFSPPLALAVLAIFLAGGLLLPALVYLVTHRAAAGLLYLRARLGVRFVDGLQGMADLQACGGEAALGAEVATIGRDLAIHERRLAWAQGIQIGANRLLQDIAVWVTLLLAVRLVSVGQMEPVYIAATVLATFAAYEAIQAIPEAALVLRRSLGAAQRLFDAIDSPSPVTDPRTPHPVTLPPHFEIRDLSFRYGDVEPCALQDFNLRLPPGRRVAIVGASGAGKSTVLRLLLRFWEFEAGEISLNGRDLREFGQEEVRALYGVVAQDSHLFNATIRENLLLARPGATNADLVSALRQVALHEFVTTLPDGYETAIGENGALLSGGQRQRLLLARALLRAAPVLLLDEPTANLDASTERALMATIAAVSRGRTLIMVTHRLVGLEMMDEIVALRHGRVVERGKHRELLQRRDYYWRLYNLQHSAPIRAATTST